MRRTFHICLFTAAFALVVGCGSKSTTAPEPARTGLDGGWTLVGMETGGKKMPEADLAKVPAAERKIKATGDKLIATKDGKEDPLGYKLNATKTPNEIDMTETNGGKTKTSYGIYKLEGDLLTICFVESEKPEDRPKEFKTTAENKAMIMVLKKD